MKKCSNEFKEETLKLSDEIGVKMTKPTRFVVLHAGRVAKEPQSGNKTA